MATVPVIESGDVLRTGLNSTLGTHSISNLAYGAGDLVIINFGVWKGNNSLDGVQTGFGGETLLFVTTGYSIDGGGNTPTSIIVYYIATGTVGAGSKDYDFSINTRHDTVMIVLPAGEFDATTPISATIGTAGATTGTPTGESFTTASDTLDGRLVNWINVDQDPISGTPSGWTDIVDHDQGRVSIVLSTRDAGLTASESLTGAGWTIGGDAWAVVSYVIRAPADVPAVDKTSTLDSEAHGAQTLNITTLGTEDWESRTTAPATIRKTGGGSKISVQGYIAGSPEDFTETDDVESNITTTDSDGADLTAENTFDGIVSTDELSIIYSIDVEIGTQTCGILGSVYLGDSLPNNGDPFSIVVKDGGGNTLSTDEMDSITADEYDDYYLQFTFVSDADQTWTVEIKTASGKTKQAWLTHVCVWLTTAVAATGAVIPVFMNQYKQRW